MAETKAVGKARGQMPAAAIYEPVNARQSRGIAGWAGSDESEALVNLGLMYSTGDGAPFDPVIAHKWFNLAAQAGSLEARTLRAETCRRRRSPRRSVRPDCGAESAASTDAGSRPRLSRGRYRP
jgi:TPR repeat protein